MPTPAYLIETADLDGPMNMALDEVLWFEAAGGQPFVRLYEWADRPALSLGYFQCADEVRTDPRLHDLPFVRRLTGGGAIVHDQEITYSIGLPARVAPSTNNLYDLVHRAIAFSLVELGIPASVGVDAARSGTSERMCFCRDDRFAVRVGGVKVLGSAQRRRPGSVLMHGSLVLASSPACPEVLGLREILGADRPAKSLRQALRRAIALAVDLELQPIELAEDLRRRAAVLADSKYRTAEWNHHRRPIQAQTIHGTTQPDLAEPVSQLDC